MPIVSKYIEVDLNDFNDDELIDELKLRGLHVKVSEYEEEEEEEVSLELLQEVIDWYKRGNIKEALIQLERIIPDLYGISGKVNE
jgi:hypothetical protein